MSSVQLWILNFKTFLFSAWIKVMNPQMPLCRRGRFCCQTVSLVEKSEIWQRRISTLITSPIASWSTAATCYLDWCSVCWRRRLFYSWLLWRFCRSNNIILCAGELIKSILHIIYSIIDIIYVNILQNVQFNTNAIFHRFLFVAEIQ